jgi:hypothetical protein
MAAMTTSIARPRRPDLVPSRGGSGTETFPDAVLRQAFSGLPGVRGMTLTDLPSGTLVYLILNDLAQEDEAFVRFAAAKRRWGSAPIELRCVSSSESESLTISQAARLYALD